MRRLLSILLIAMVCINLQATLREWNNTAMEGYLSYTGSPVKEGQTFTVGNTGTNQSFILDSIAFYVHNAVNGNFTFEIFALSGGYPTGSALSSKTATSLVVGYNYIDMPSKVLIASTSYAIVLTSSVLLTLDYNSAYTGGGYIYYDGSWSDRGIGSSDLLFEVYGRLTPTITTHPSSIERCTGASATFSVVVDSDSPTYKWRKGGIDIGGATSSSYTKYSVVSGDAGSYDCVVTESLLGTTATSNAATLTVNTYINITVQPEDADLCEGSDVVFNVTATGTLASPNYQWYKDDVAIYQANSSSYSIDNITTADEANYNVLVIGTCGTVLSDDGLLRVADMDYETLLSGLVSYWGFNGTGTYTTESDQSGSNHGTVTNVTRLGTSDFRSQYGHFDSNTDYITLTSTDTRTVGTYSFWVYPTDRTDDRIIMGNDPYYSRIFLGITSGALKLETNTNGEEFGFYTSVPPLNQWSYVALVRNGNDVSYYYNGTFISTVTISGANALSFTQIGRNGRSFRGDIDEVSIYDRVLTSAEISLLYHGTKGITYGMLNVCDYGYVPPAYSTHKKILLKSKLRNILLAGIEREYGGVTSTEVVSSYYGYDSTSVLSCTQKFAIPEDVDNSDVVGTWLKTWTWMSGNTISYSIETNHNGAFAINSSSGVITIADATKIDGKIVATDTLINLVIRTSDPILGQELDTAKIWVKENAHCLFFDNGGAGAGTRSDPHDDLNDAAMTTGYGYFMKRGVTFTSQTNAISTHIATAAHPTIIGAYGSGDRPIFDGVGGTTQGFFFGSMADWTNGRCEYIYMYDLEIKEYHYIAMEVYSKSKNMGFYNLYMHENDPAGVQSNFVISTNDYADTASYMPFELINCVFESSDPTHVDNLSHIKVGASPVYITNCYFGRTLGGALRLADGSYGAKIKYTTFNTLNTDLNDTHNSIQCRMHNTTVEDCRFIGSTHGLRTASPGDGTYFMPDNLVVRNCYFYGQLLSAIFIQPNTNSDNNNVGHIYENNLIKNVEEGIRFRDMKTLIIRRNTIIGGSYATYGIIGHSSESSSGISIYYNVIYGFPDDEINIPLSTSLTVYNNTVDGSITLTGSTSPITRNNFYRSSNINTSNNIDLDDIVPTNYFIDYAGHNYRLKSTATGAIDVGYNVSLTPDMIGTTVPQGSATDIGAYEYIP